MKRPIQKFDLTDSFFKENREVRQDFFILFDGVISHMFQYIMIESMVLSPGNAEGPDLIAINLGTGRGCEITGHDLIRILWSFQARALVFLTLGRRMEDKKDVEIHSIEVNYKSPDGKSDLKGMDGKLGA